MAVTLDALISTEAGLQQAAQATVSSGESAKAAVKRLAAVVADLAAVKNARDATLASTGTSLAALGKTDSTQLQARIQAALTKVKLDDAKLNAVIGALPGKKYADLVAAAQAADADVLAKRVDAEEKWADADCARRKVEIREKALDAYVASLTSASVTAQSLVGISLDATSANLAQAWWQVQKSLALASVVTKAASAKALSDAVKAACDNFASAEQAALAADDALAAALDAKTKADADVGAAESQILTALVAAVKAAMP